MRKYKLILGISVDSKQPFKIDRIFAIPSIEFGNKNFCIFSEKDKLYNKFHLSECDLKEKVLEISQEIGFNVLNRQNN